MNLEQIHYLAKINQCHSLRQASEKLHITAQALSQSISSLENELGLHLTESSRHGSYLTKEGHILLDAGEEFLRVVAELQSASQQTSYKYLPKSSFNILAVEGLSIAILPNIISQLYLEYPKISVKICNMNSCHQLLDYLCNSCEHDFAFISVYKYKDGTLPDLSQYPSLEFQPLFVSKYCCTIPEGHEIAHYSSVSLNTILKYPILLHKPSEEILLPLLEAYGTPKKIISIPDFSVFNQLLNDSPYLSLVRLSNSFDASMPLNKRRILPLKDNINIVFGYVYRQDSELKPANKEFLDYVSAYCKSHYGDLDAASNYSKSGFANI